MPKTTCIIPISPRDAFSSVVFEWLTFCMKYIRSMKDIELENDSSGQNTVANPKGLII